MHTESRRRAGGSVGASGQNKMYARVSEDVWQANRIASASDELRQPSERKYARLPLGHKNVCYIFALLECAVHGVAGARRAAKAKEANK